MNMFLILILAYKAISFPCLEDPSEGYLKIVGGYPVSISKAPYQVWIAFRSQHEAIFGKGFLCGGTLISRNVVLSAAHCFAFFRYYRNNQFVVVAGCSTMNKAQPSTLQFRVRKIVPHEDFDASSYRNDIAMVFLRDFIPFDSQNVKAIALAEKRPKVRQMCQISGWGITVPGNPNNPLPQKSPELKQASVPIQSHEECLVVYPEITRSRLCAGFKEGRIDACQGDSGGPMVCSNHLAGITSYGHGCAQNNTPGVYTDVSYFLNWIQKINETYGYRNSAICRRKVYNLPISVCLPVFLFLCAF